MDTATEAKPIHASHFTWTGLKGLACASDLGYKAGQVPAQRVWVKGKFAWGLKLQGKKEVLTFILCDAHRDGGVAPNHWTYRGTLASGATAILKIFND